MTQGEGGKNNIFRKKKTRLHATAERLPPIHTIKRETGRSIKQGGKEENAKKKRKIVEFIKGRPPHQLDGGHQ